MAEKATEDFNIVFLGDLMLDRHVKERIKKQGLDYFFLDFAKEADLTAAKLVSANLEGAVTNKGSHYSPANSYDFAFSPEELEKLKKYNFSFFTIANNHILDQGEQGLKETTQNLQKLNYQFAGCADAKIDNCSDKTIELNGKKIGMFGLSMVYNDFDMNAVLKRLDIMKADTDLIIVNIHWGLEYQHSFSKKQQEVGHQLIDGGADVIIGHHPHVVQGMEIYKDKPIFYSLGNFIFDQYFSADTQEGLAVRLNSDDGELKFTFMPFASKGSKPNLLAQEEKSKFLKKFTNWSSLEESIKPQIKEGKLIIKQ